MRERHDYCGDLGGRHIFALPPKSFSYTINKIKITLFVLLHQVTGPKPGVPFFEHVTNDFFIGSVFARVTFKLTSKIRCSADNSAHCFTYFVGGTLYTEALFVAQRFSLFNVEF